MKNSNDTIGNRTRDLPACNAVPQPLRHRVPPHFDDSSIKERGASAQKPSGYSAQKENGRNAALFLYTEKETYLEKQGKNTCRI